MSPTPAPTPLPPASRPRRALATGCEMIARAAMDVGCRYFAGYPITPASQIFEVMTRELPERGGLASSAPDEISALAWCLGASIRGVPSMTATSGPGWALMVESVGYAVMTETPVVIAMVQRLGPSTGAATGGAQGDVGMVSQAVSGGYTIPVLAASTAQEAYEETLRAFEIAERLRTPVVLLADKEVASTTEVVEPDRLPAPPALLRPTFSGPGTYRPYAFGAPGEVPAFAPAGGPHKVTVTGSAHDFDGHLRKDDPEVLAVLRHLEQKIAGAEASLGRLDLDGAGADTLVLSFGVSSRASREAVAQARAEGRAVAMGNLRTLFPVPRTALVAALDGVRRVVVVEENMGGQYAQVLAPLLGDRQLVRVNGLGKLIAPAEIRHGIG
ncbi:pyruvate flavodoxin/ferredoxin oxidoreductase [Myxococcota bacterium]|nr:pyruvate flavodoxin/ferredoxin oxidoreductase [Myxococcota bacterium]